MNHTSRDRALAARASKSEAIPRRRVMLRLYAEGRSCAEISESLVRQGLLAAVDEKKVQDELKACLERQKARDRHVASVQSYASIEEAPPPPSEG